MLLDEITFGTISNECLELEFSNPKHSFCIESKDSRGSVESFKSALFQANIIDALNTDFYGSYVVLPNGLKLFQMFFDIVTQLYQDFGLIEFDFPMVTSPLAFTKSKNILDLTDNHEFIESEKPLTKEIEMVDKNILKCHMCDWEHHNPSEWQNYKRATKQAKEIMETEAKRVNMPYVCDRWLGGMLTNFGTVRKSIKKMQTLEKLAQDGTYTKIRKSIMK